MSIGSPRILALLFVLAGVTVSAEAQSKSDTILALPQRTKSLPPGVTIEQLTALSTGAFVVKWSVQVTRGITVQSQTVEIVTADAGVFQRSPVIQVLGSARQAVVTIPGFTPEPGDTLKVTASVVSTLGSGFASKQTIKGSKSVTLQVIQPLERPPEVDVKGSNK